MKQSIHVKSNIGIYDPTPWIHLCWVYI